MALSASELQDLKARCRKAQATGFGIGKAESHLASLAAELGMKSPGPATAENLLKLIGLVEDARAGKPVKIVEAPPPKAPKAAPHPPAPHEDEDEEEDENEEEDEAKPAVAPRPKKPSGGSKKKTSKKR